MNLNKIIEEWVDKQYFYDENLKRNLKSNIPQLTDRIVEEIKQKLFEIGELNLPYKYINGKPNYSETLSNMTLEEMIEEFKYQSIDIGYGSRDY